MDKLIIIGNLPSASEGLKLTDEPNNNDTIEFIAVGSSIVGIGTIAVLATAFLGRPLALKYNKYQTNKANKANALQKEVPKTIPEKLPTVHVIEPPKIVTKPSTKQTVSITKLDIGGRELKVETRNSPREIEGMEFPTEPGHRHRIGGDGALAEFEGLQSYFRKKQAYGHLEVKYFDGVEVGKNEVFMLGKDGKSVLAVKNKSPENTYDLLAVSIKKGGGMLSKEEKAKLNFGYFESKSGTSSSDLMKVELRKILEKKDMGAVHSLEEDANFQTVADQFKSFAYDMYAKKIYIHYDMEKLQSHYLNNF